MGAAGIQTGALAFGGDSSPKAVTELWNGTNWTEVNDLNEGRERLGGDGTSTSALAFGGNPNPSGKTESWNGTNWAEVVDMIASTQNAGSAGLNNTSGLSFGGDASGVPRTTATEEFISGSITKTISTS